MGDAPEEDSRWTCEACGCNTNQSSDRTCTICGTSPSGPSILRRPGAYAARVGWIARGLRRPEDLEEDDLWESVVDHMAEAAAPSAAAAAAPRPDPTNLLQTATEQNYNPIWTSSPGWQVEGGVAHAAAEGRAIRSSSPLPTGSGPVGFRVAFDHPAAEVGGNMGGCHLIGVTTASFTAFNDQNALQQSAFFWGVEDGGQKYEGRRRSRHEFVDAPLNAANVLFGCRQVMTVVCDWESRSLTFWRDGALLGTLVTHLPRSGNLFPVAVPFNCGVTVALTGLQEDPLPLLRDYASDCRRKQQNKEAELRRKLAAKRARLIQGESLTPQVMAVLKTIFESYDKELNYTQACRLWYRCGIKLALMPLAPVTYKDFIAVIGQVLVADVVPEANADDSSPPATQVGDKVQLVSGYESFGDSAGGPLQPGDRGTVVEIQRGPNGERRSLRVFHNGRRWWYQPQAVVSERSGLIDSPAVWFLDNLLRLHGYDSETLEPMTGKPVTSWRLGDVVSPKKAPADNLCYARIVPETSPRPAVHSRDSGSVLVEFVGISFPEATGIKIPTSAVGPLGLQTRRVRVSKLVHGVAVGNHGDNDDDWEHASLTENQDESKEEVKSETGEKDEPERKLAPVGDKLIAEIAAVSRLEHSAMDAVAKECKKSSDALASLFSAGLPEAVLSAIDVAAKQMNSLEPREDLFENIAAIGVLVAAIAEKLYTDKCTPHVAVAAVEDSEDSDSMVSEHAAEPSSLLPPGILAGRRRGDDLANLPQLMNASLQQRRGMLLSLLSRGGRRRALNDLNERRNAIDAGLVQGPFGVQPSFVFGAPLAGEQGNSNSSSALWESNAASMNEADISPNRTASNDVGILDSILRCRGDCSDALSGSLRQGGPTFFAFVRHLISSGILVNSCKWVEALVDSYQSKKSSSSQRASSILRNAVDEDGTPVLQLAILLGCNTDIIRFLISCGSPVGMDELKKAANTNQPRTLALLLQHSSYCEGVISIEDCSDQVREVLDQARKRQDELDRQMRDAAGAFIASVTKKLIALGLASRRNQSSRTVICSKVLVGVLVGDVLLRALQQAQKPAESHEDSSSAAAGGRVPVEDSMASLSPEGLLRYLPRSVIGETVFGDKESATTFFLLLEDYLCSKDMFDAAAGLTLLSIVLNYFPQIGSSPVLQRYGFCELVSFHDVLASNRIAEILSKEFTAGLDVSSSKSECSSRNLSTGTRHDGAGVVRCPKKHTAVLHITRHSSFRCDICGSGVDRGKPMHGCRECDWDACEDCTDKSESGLIKCTSIRELACDILRLLETEEKDEVAGDFPHAHVLAELSQDDSTMALNAIAVRLLQHDVEAMKELGILLQEPGRVSFHQFFSAVLPAVHASLSGRTSEGDGSIVTNRPKHKNKKARVAGCADSTSLSPDSRFEYCRASVLCLLEDVSKPSEDAMQEDRSTATRDQDDQKPSVLGSSSSALSLKGEIAYSTLASELLRRIHQVLSFYEGVSMFSSSLRSLDITGGEKGGELHTLTKPMEIQLMQYSLSTPCSDVRLRRLQLDVELLVPVVDLELHIRRSCRINDQAYLTYCQNLATDSAVMVERPLLETTGSWQVARVVDYNDQTGAHRVQYANLIPELEKNRSYLDVGDISFEDDKSIVFDGPVANLILAARDYVVVHRRKDGARKKAAGSPGIVTRSTSESLATTSSNLAHAVGTRVESNCGVGETWKTFTLIGIDTASSLRSGRGARAVLVSDEGIVFSGIPTDQIRFRGHTRADDNNRESESLRLARQVSEDRNSLRRSFPFTFGSRQRPDSETSTTAKPGTLKRTWSAIALATAMQPVDINIPTSVKKVMHAESCDSPIWLCRIGEAKVTLTCRGSSIEIPPELSVKFSTSDKLPPVSLAESPSTTLAHALTLLHRRQEKWSEWPPRSSCNLFFTLGADDPRPLSCAVRRERVAMECDSVSSAELSTADSSLWTGRSVDRSRKFSARSLSPEREEAEASLCDGLDEICMQCMDVIGILSQHAEDSSEATESDRPTIPGFANPSLSKKLTDQLDDPLCVVGGALPEWCTRAPTFAPRAFSYQSRQLLVQRAAFGVSRSALKQQESKVNVGRLRQRMASLRARAVELMGEAFSGGAEDPSSLQIQADELYGMEETLAARVRAAFRAAKWQEHSLQVAKAAVRRDNILEDAAAIMERYAKDPTVNRRRLEVRFDGETGFDAASGDEAGVTRGFYADVAEALLSSENVAGVLCSSTCASLPTDSSKNLDAMDVESTDEEICKLPVWIPDMDTSGQVVIPTPRADSRSSLGVYPRPLPHYHPQIPQILYHFRLMGRIFAAAMRDGFMFPLPLSASFLKLVQHGGGKTEATGDTNSKPASQQDILLSAADLPRPGFLGGEVYAADVHICRALNTLDALDPPLPRVELQRRYQEIATDKNFARVALGMSYDCSFEDYFQDRTFVDPLDPTQGEEAAPLCPRGHKKAVTIYNVREWVDLAKSFILHDGVMSQAVAFREGVEDFFSAQFLRLFTPDELQRDVCGTGDNVDSWDENAVRKLFKLNGGKEALVAVAAIGGEGGAAMSRRFGPSSPTIAFLVKALLEATPRQRRQFLSFVTSVPIVTPGRIEVVPMVSPSGEFLPMEDPTCLPRANTCARRLYLPKFDTFESFSDVLWAVVREESRFKGFYEWRGSS